MYLKLSKHEKTTKNRVQRYLALHDEFSWDDSGLLLGGETKLKPKKQGLLSIETPSFEVKRWAVQIELHPEVYEASSQAPIFPKVVTEGHSGTISIKLKLSKEITVPYLAKVHIVPVGLA